MKTKINLILLFIAISISFLKGQELPEVPLKNGMAYYVFEHKLDNTAKCLSSYVDAPLAGNTLLPFHEKIIKKASNFSFSNLKTSCIILLQRKLVSLKCQDTLKYSASNVTINEFTNKWKPTFIVKKIASSKITANISFVFLSKNEYKLIIKDIVYTGGETVSMGKVEFHDYKFGESYQTVKKSDKISKGDITFFNDIDSIIKEIDKIILEALTDTYTADEL
jgi:hypothetical protein